MKLNDPIINLKCKDNEFPLPKLDWIQFAYFRCLMRDATIEQYENCSVSLNLDDGFTSLLLFLKSQSLGNGYSGLINCIALRDILLLLGIDADSLIATKAEMLFMQHAQDYGCSSHAWNVLELGWGPLPSGTNLLGNNFVTFKSMREVIACSLIPLDGPSINIMNNSVLKRLKNDSDLTEKEIYLKKLIENIYLKQQTELPHLV